MLLVERQGEHFGGTVNCRPVWLTINIISDRDLWQGLLPWVEVGVEIRTSPKSGGKGILGL